MPFLPTCFALIWCSLFLAEAAPWRSIEAQQSQACGDKLADIMSLVCSGRGYNVAFRPEGRRSTRRIRRGIVEECCRKSCSPAMLELYCRADPLEAPSNVQIRKRSDSGMDSTDMQQEGEIFKSSPAETETQNTITQANKVSLKENSKSTTVKEGKDNYKLLNLLFSSEQSTYKQNTRNVLSKPIQNDTTEEEFYKEINNPPMRHHKSHHNTRQFHRHKASAKTKREKSMSGDSTQTFQIGTVKPYFAGRALASYRSNYVHHAPLS